MAAIFMWRLKAQQVLTTTLYPVDANDGLDLSLALTKGTLAEIPHDELTVTEELISASYIQTRWFLTDAYEDSLTATEELVSASYTQVRWFFTDSYEESLTVTEELVDATYIRKLVEADSPDEGLQFSLAIKDTCSMGLV